MEFLDEEARTGLLNDLEPGEVLFDGTIAVSQVLLEAYDPPAGAASTRLTLTMQVEYSARYASASDLTELASLALNASLPAGFVPAPDAVTLDPVTTPAVAPDGSARWMMRAERGIVQSLDEGMVTQLVSGQNLAEAQRRLSNSLPLESAPEIRMSPSWWGWIPILPFRIDVVTE
jgi:hypothetical protein